MSEATEPRTIQVCACGCDIPIEEARRQARANSGWLNPDQAEAGVRSKWIEVSS